MPGSAEGNLRRHFAAVACAALLAAAGCSDEKSGRLVDYLDESEFDVPLETAAYVSLGKYDVPIAATRKVVTGSTFVKEIDAGATVWMRLQFELTAETTPAHEKAVLEAVEKHRGALNDAVLTIVRTSSVEELADPRLGAMNSRLSEIARPLLGEDRIRQLVFNDANSAEADKHSGHGGDEHSGGHGSHGEGEGGVSEHDSHDAGHVAEHSTGSHEEDSHGHH